MRLTIYQRDVSGSLFWYMAEPEPIRRAVQTLTGKRTLGDADLAAFETLGVTFKRDQNADPRTQRRRKKA